MFSSPDFHPQPIHSMYSTLSSATSAAQAKARKVCQWVYIFWDDDGYALANDFDCETWFAGSDPVRVVAPCGNVETE
jgi:hypothetical protein